MRAILWGGLLAATFDLAFAVIFNYLRSGVPPVRIFQSIASGWLGKAAFEGGAGSAALGVASHYFILLVAAAVYYAASRKLVFLVQRAVLWGVIYGGTIYLFMHTVVLPLSAAPAFKSSLFSMASDLCSHMFLVGLVIALAVRRDADRSVAT
jgi:hypothetical protein